jgi:hypothetical protein
LKSGFLAPETQGFAAPEAEVDGDSEQRPPTWGKRLHAPADLFCPYVVATRPFRFGTRVGLLSRVSFNPLLGLPCTVEARHERQVGFLFTVAGLTSDVFP